MGIPLLSPEKLIDDLFESSRVTAMELTSMVENPNILKDYESRARLIQKFITYHQLAALETVLRIYREFSPLPTPCLDQITVLKELFREKLKTFD